MAGSASNRGGRASERASWSANDEGGPATIHVYYIVPYTSTLQYFAVETTDRHVPNSLRRHILLLPVKQTPYFAQVTSQKTGSRLVCTSCRPRRPAAYTTVVVHFSFGSIHLFRRPWASAAEAGLLSTSCLVFQTISAESGAIKTRLPSLQWQSDQWRDVLHRDVAVVLEPARCVAWPCLWSVQEARSRICPAASERSET